MCPAGSGVAGAGERERLVQEVTKLYRERNRLARIHRKAELRVLTSLRRRRQVGSTVPVNTLCRVRRVAQWSSTSLGGDTSNRQP